MGTRRYLGTEYVVLGLRATYLALTHLLNHNPAFYQNVFAYPLAILQFRGLLGDNDALCE
jgi:hypothetical protein